MIETKRGMNVVSVLIRFLTVIILIIKAENFLLFFTSSLFTFKSSPSHYYQQRLKFQQVIKYNVCQISFCKFYFTLLTVDIVIINISIKFPDKLLPNIVPNFELILLRIYIYI